MVWIQIPRETYPATLQGRQQEAWLDHQHVRGRRGALALSSWYLGPDSFGDATGVTLCGTEAELQASLMYVHPCFSTASWLICLSLWRGPPSPKAVCGTATAPWRAGRRQMLCKEGGKKGLKDRGRDRLQLADVQG